ncbi:anaphase-promoting complex subunit Cut9 [Coemansia sp. BCRC 34301]|nr:anaphase-promoting complex subunit Cut9 [Coemansia sp. BCRC 34301]
MSEVVAHLRALRADCAKGLAWCSALVWAEKAFLLTDDTEDLLWLVDALVTNGQYRQAEEWLVNPLYTSKCLDSTTGRYLASVVAMRLGRAEDALDMLNIDLAQTIGSLGARRDGAPLARSSTAHTPTAARAPVGGAYTPTLGAQRSLLDEIPIIAKDSRQDKSSRDGEWVLGEPVASDGIRPLNPRALMLYMQGAAVVQLSNIGGSEATPSIKSLRLRYPESISASVRGSASANVAATTALGGMGTLVGSIWIEALRADVRCWEAWSGIREHGLLTCDEELQLVYSLDWTACCGGSQSVGQFFRDYCLATQTTFSLSSAAVEATDRILSAYPRLAEDPALRAIQAARLLSLGRARACLEYTICALEYRRIPDPGTTAVHITALTVLYAKDALFRIAHELAEEFGISSIKRAEIEPADTRLSLGSSASIGAGLSSIKAGSANGFLYGTPLSTPRTASMGAAVAGTGRVRAGARGLLVPETPTRAGMASALTGGNSAAGVVRRPTAATSSFAITARYVTQSASAAATAAWRGLWGLPTWTHPGPPVLATYPCALGPAQASTVNVEASISTLGTFTTTSAQSIGSPTQYEFIGASLAWYAIGCYYLVAAARQALPDISQHEWALSGVFYRSGLAVSTAGHPAQGGSSISAMRHNHSLTSDTEHALAEARRWLAKTTLASPRSVVAWVAFAHTFIVAGEWESATRALHTAVGLCGCEDVVHGGGRDSAPEASVQQTPKSTSAAARLERGSQLAHAPLASLGSVYLRMGDLGMAESCFDASARCLCGYQIEEWLAAWKSALDSLDNTAIIEWCSPSQPSANDDDNGDDGAVRVSSMADPQLLNDIGVLFYNKGQLDAARVFFAVALKALNRIFGMQHKLHAAFNHGVQKSSRRQMVPPEFLAFSALYNANLGNTLRRAGDYDSALACLQAAATNAPTSTDILLSEAFTMHLRAMDRYSKSEAGFDNDLDKAIDSYHRILASLPGDSVTTDLLTLALELSANIQSLPLFTDDLDITKELEEPLLAFGLDDHGDYDDYDDELGGGSYAYGDSPPFGAVSDLSQAHQHSDAAASEQASAIGGSGDEAMEIEEDSESDMAMD